MSQHNNNNARLYYLNLIFLFSQIGYVYDLLCIMKIWQHDYSHGILENGYMEIACIYFNFSFRFYYEEGEKYIAKPTFGCDF